MQKTCPCMASTTVLMPLQHTTLHPEISFKVDNAPSTDLQITIGEIMRERAASAVKALDIRHVTACAKAISILHDGDSN